MRKYCIFLAGTGVCACLSNFLPFRGGGVIGLVLYDIIGLCLFASLVTAPFLWRKHRFKVFWPILIVVTFLYLQFPAAVFGQKMRCARVEKQLPEYHQVIRMLQAGSLPAANLTQRVFSTNSFSGTIQMPRGFTNLDPDWMFVEKEGGNLKVKLTVAGGWPILVSHYVWDSSDGTNAALRIQSFNGKSCFAR